MSKRFPRTESEIAALALRVVEGLVNAAEDFPNPPVPPDELRAKRRHCDAVTGCGFESFRVCCAKAAQLCVAFFVPGGLFAVGFAVA